MWVGLLCEAHQTAGLICIASAVSDVFSLRNCQYSVRCVSFEGLPVQCPRNCQSGQLQSPTSLRGCRLQCPGSWVLWPLRGCLLQSQLLFLFWLQCMLHRARGCVWGCRASPSAPPPCGDAPWAQWARLGLPGEGCWSSESRWSALDPPTPPSSYNTILVEHRYSRSQQLGSGFWFRLELRSQNGL
jgi:hypothetical protein